MIKEIAIFSPIYISLFWALVLIIQIAEKNNAKRMLGFFMINVMFLFSCHGVFFSNHYRIYSSVEFIYIFAMLAAYPLYYLYLKMIASDNIEIKKHLFHLLPAIFFSTLIGLFTLFLSPEERTTYVKEILIENNLKGLDLNTLPGIKGLLFLISRIFLLIEVTYYGIRGAKLVNQHNARIANYYSNTEGKTLKWVFVINLVVLVGGISSITLLMLGRGFFSKHEVSLIFPSSIFSILLFIIGFKGIQQQRIYSDFKEDNFELENYEETSDKSNAKLRMELIKLFEEKKVYTNPNLRITHLSSQLKTNRTYISKLINDEFRMNFNEFVNQYRVKEAKSLMKNTDYRYSTLDEIADNSGFGSLNSFARIFKEKTGKTPGKYREQFNNISA